MTGDGEESMVMHFGVEQLGRIGKVDLVYIVVDRATASAGEVRDGQPIVAETGCPPAAIETRQLLHDVNLVETRGVALLLDRPDEDSLGAMLRRLRAEIDTHGRLVAGHVARRRLKTDKLRRRARSRWPASD